jgi:hypothetical protein
MRGSPWRRRLGLSADQPGHRRRLCYPPAQTVLPVACAVDRRFHSGRLRRLADSRLVLVAGPEAVDAPKAAASSASSRLTHDQPTEAVCRQFREGLAAESADD